MIPTAKSKNFMDLSISGLHVLILTHQELHRLSERCPYSRLSEYGASSYSAPMYEKAYKILKKTGRVGFDNECWYNIDEEASESDED